MAGITEPGRLRRRAHDGRAPRGVGAAREASTPRRRPLAVRLGWFALIWACSVLALGVVGFAIRLALH